MSDKPSWPIRIGHFYKKEKIQAGILTLILLSNLVLLWTALFEGEQGLPWPPYEALKNWITKDRGFSARQWMSLITPAAALLIAVFAHWLDEQKHGRGLRDIRKTMSLKYDLKTEVIAASMTKQSVLAAIASILIVMIQGAPKSSDYLRFVSFISIFGFVFAIVLLLVSMVCYDYASRFTWGKSYKVELVHKALRFDTLAWYFLFTSLVLSTALISTRLSVITGMFAGILMWRYYFFSRKETDLYIRGLSDVVISVADLSTAKEFYGDKLGLKIDEKDGEVNVQVGDWSNVKLVQATPSGITSPEIVFTLSPNDFDAALETLTKNNVNYTQEPATHSIKVENPDKLPLRIRTFRKTQ